jgi:hypothetical protein
VILGVIYVVFLRVLGLHLHFLRRPPSWLMLKPHRGEGVNVSPWLSTPADDDEVSPPAVAQHLQVLMMMMILSFAIWCW